MAHNYLQPVNDHFNMDKLTDVDDDIFLNSPRANSINRPQRSTNPFDYDDDDVSTTLAMDAQRQAYAEKRRQVEQRTLESTEKSLGLLIETEEVGKATAVELQRQREQLEKTSSQLDSISSTLRVSQRHLNGLKSVFGGLKNYLSGNRDTVPPIVASPTSSQASQETNSNINYGAGACGGSSYDGYSSRGGMSPTERYDNHPVSRLRDDTSMIHQRQAQQQQMSSQPYQQRVESNLNNMCNIITDLKSMALDLGTEIDSQNELIDNMNYKIEDIDSKVIKQNKDMNRLLKK